MSATAKPGTFKPIKKPAETLTKLEKIAVHAMGAILTAEWNLQRGLDPAMVANAAFQYTNAMIHESKKPAA